MGLINLQTNLKSLKFGNDRIGGGNSKQPYIQTPIPDQLGEYGFLNQDFILRGGSKAVTDSATDVVRLGKYFTDLNNPSGLLFVAKQNLLSRMAVRTQASGKILNEGIYTPLSTLVEAGGVAFGLHAYKQGLNPFGGIGGINTYSDEIQQSKTPIGWDINDRLTVLYGFKIINDDPVYNLKGITVDSGEVNVLSYKGGPGSVLGIGKTNIKFADQRTGLNNPNYGKDSKYQAEKRNIDINYRNGLGLSVKYDNESINYETYNLNNDINTGINSKGQGFKYFVGQNDNQLISNVFNKNDAKSYLAEKRNIDVNYNNTLGLSISSSLSSSLNTEEATGINKQGQLIKSSNPTSTGFLASNQIKDNIVEPLGISYGWSLNSDIQKVSKQSSKNGKGSNYYYALKNTSPKINFVTYDVNQIFNAEPVTVPGGKIIDFRQKLKNSTYFKQLNSNQKSLLPSTQIDYTGNKILEQRTNLGDPGNKTGKNLTSYTNGVRAGEIVGKSGGNASNNSYDTINALPIYCDTTPDEDKYGIDLVKFRIGVIDNDTPSLKTYIHFRAFLNQISDAYTAEWSGTKYIGRGENFYTYNGFDRKVSLSWTVAAQSKAELIPMYKKLNYLASICTPDYSANGYMRGNIVTLTIGGYFYEQPGIITGFNYEMNEDNSTWEVGINDTGDVDQTVKELPHVIKVSGFNFIPIHTFVPRKQVNNYDASGGVLDDNNKYGKERYIALQNKDNNNYGPYAKYPQPDPIPTPDPSPIPPPNPLPNPNPSPTPPPPVPTSPLAVSTYNLTITPPNGKIAGTGSNSQNFNYGGGTGGGAGSGGVY